MVLYTQVADSCAKMSSFSICNPESHPLVFLYGGYTLGGISSSLLVLKVGPEPSRVTFCNPGEYLARDDYGVTRCLSCPRTSYNTDGITCLNCPFGGICPGGAIVRAAKGNWMDQNTSMSLPILYQCPFDTCCDETEGCLVEETCRFNTTGPLCSTCDSPSQKLWANHCVDCTKPNLGYFLALLVLGAIQLSLVVFIGGYFPILASNVIFAYQIHSLIIAKSEYQSAISVLFSFNAEINLTFVSSVFDACLAPISGLGKGLTRLFFALYPLILVSIFISVKYRSKYLDNIKWNKIAQRTWLVALVSVLPVFASISSIFSCRETSYLGVTKSRMVEFPEVICSEPSFIASAFLVFLLILLPIIIVIICTQYFVHKNQDRFDSQSLTLVLSHDYKCKYYYWWIIEILSRSTLGILAATFRFAEIDYAWSMFIAAMCLLILHQYTTPYANKIENWAQFFLIVSILGNCATQISTHAVEKGEIVDRNSPWSFAPQFIAFWLFMPVSFLSDI
jgi:hypothetical protein